MKHILMGLAVLAGAGSPLMADGVAATQDGRILVLDNDGALFLAGSDTTKQLVVEMPINGADFLLDQLDEGDFGDVLDATDHLRYSDVMLAQDGKNIVLIVSYTEFHIDENCFTSTLAKAVLPEAQSLDDVKITTDDWIDVARDTCLEPFEDGLPIYGLKAGGRLAQVSGSTDHVIWTVGDDAEVLDVNLATGDYDVIARDR